MGPQFLRLVQWLHDTAIGTQNGEKRRRGGGAEGRAGGCAETPTAHVIIIINNIILNTKPRFRRMLNAGIILSVTGELVLTEAESGLYKRHTLNIK